MPPPEAVNAVGRIKVCPVCWKPKWSARPLETPICQCGAKVKLTPEIVSRLEAAFATSKNISRACSYAEISRDTYYDWMREFPELSDRFARIREKLPLKAEENIARSIHGGSISDSWRLLEKRDPDYTEKLKVEHSGHMDSSAAAASSVEAAAWQEYLQKRRADRQRRALEDDKEYQELKKQQYERPATGEVAGEVGRPEQVGDSGGSNTAGN